MKKKPDISPKTELRRRAEEIFRDKGAQLLEKMEVLTPEVARKTLHELRVHQIELEMQNEELHRAQAELDATRARYFDLFDLAPAGYCTLSESGLILEANLTAAALLGMTRSELAKQPISRFIFKEDQDIYYLHRKNLFETGEPQAYDLRIVKKDGTTFWGRMEATVAQEADGTLVCRLVMSDNPEHERAEEALRKSQVQYLDLYENAPDMYISVDPDTSRIVRCNERLVRITGYTKEEIIGMPVFEMYHPDCLEKARKTFQQFITTGEVHDVELQARCKDGSKIDVSLNVSAVRDASGKILYSRSSWRDISERKRAEKALHESEQIFKHFMKHSPIYVFFKDKNIRSIRLSKNYETLLGKPMEELLGKHMDEIFPSEFSKKIIADDIKVLNDGKEVIIEEELNGRNYLTIKFPIHIDEKPHYIAGYTIDITERKKAEEELLKSQKKFQALVETTSDFIWEMDINGVYSYCSPQMEKLWGFKSEEMIGKTPFDLLPPGGKEQAMEVFSALCKSASPFTNMEISSLDSAGQVKFLEISGVPFFDIGGNLCGYRGITRDITERRQVQEKLQKSEAMFKTQFENSPDIIIVLDRDYRYMSINKVKFGPYSVEDLIGQDAIQVLPPRVQNMVRSKIEHCFVSGVIQEFDHEVSEDAWVRARVVPLPSSDSINHVMIISTDITENRRAEQKVIESEERYRRITDGLTDYLYTVKIKDGKAVETIHNEACVAVTGYSSKEFEADPYLWINMVIAEERELVNERFLNILEGNNLQPFEHRIICKNGKIRWVSDTAIPKYDSNGVMVAYDGVIKDITERKRVEDELHQEQLFSKSVLDSLPGIFFLYTYPDCKLVLWNNKLEMTFGFTNEEMHGRYVADLYVPEDKEGVLNIVETVMKTGFGSIKNSMLTKDGRSLPFFSTAVKFKIQGQLYFMGIGIDITERKQAEEALWKSEASLAAAQRIAHLGSWEWDMISNTVRCSKEMFWVFDISPDTFDGKPESLLKAIHPDDVELFTNSMKSNLSDGNSSSLEYRVIHKDGSIHTLFADGRIELDNAGKPIRSIGTVQDITERKRLEEEIRQMQKLEGLGTLAGGIAHDFNNILGIIMVYVASINRYKADPKKLDNAINIILKSVDRGKAIVQQILTFAKKSDVTFGPVNVNDVAMEIMVMVFETFPKIITYSQNYDKEIPSIRADYSQLYQALLNLCLNARDAMPEGGVLTITTRMVSVVSLRHEHPEAAASSYVCMEVSDTGEGMTAETQKRIFEPFFTTKEPGKGTGLGLSVVIGIIQTHKGFVDVESSLGKGTTFRLYLPALQAAALISVNDEETLEGIPGGTETLLVVEDEEMLMMSLRTALVEKGYNVLSAKNGLEAVHIYKERKQEIALVLTDLGLPKITGMEVSKRIMQLNPNARIIVATGFLDPEMKAKFLNTSVKDFLLKPYDLKKVLKVVRNVLDELPSEGS